MVNCPNNRKERKRQRKIREKERRTGPFIIYDPVIHCLGRERRKKVIIGEISV